MLKRIEILNFKGITSLEVELKEQTVIRGQNASGKTSIADAIAWVLTGRDTHGRSPGAKGFEIKPRGIHGVEVSVTLTFDDGLVVGKTVIEKWVKRRGASEREFHGHEESRIWHGVPVGVRDFQGNLRERFPGLQELFPASAFCALPWRNQRAVLGEMSGVTMDMESIADILRGNSLDAARKGLKASRLQAEKTLEAIPARIDEATRQIADVQDVEPIEAKIEELEARQKALQEADAGAMPVDRINEISGRLLGRRRQLAEINESHDRAIAEYSRAKAAAEARAIAAQNAKDSARLEVLSAQTAYLDLCKSTPLGTCPTCNQDLPEDQIEAANQQLAQRKAEAAEAFCEKRDVYAACNAALEAEPEVPKRPEAPDTSELLDEITRLERQLYVLRQPQRPRNAGELAEIKKKIAEWRQQIAAAQASERAKARVEELRQEAVSHQEIIDELTKKLNRLETAERDFAEALSRSVNAHFRFVSWTLFREQINGGIEACCECRAPSGSTYTGNMSHSERIRADVDIHNALSSHYGCSGLPVVIDDAESIAVLPETESQMIVLEVESDRREPTITL